MKSAHYAGNRTFTIEPCRVIPPGQGEVRLAVAYTGICGTDLHIYHGAMDRRVQPPRIIGHEMSGTVAEVGPGVEDLAVGDAVVVRPLDARGEEPADRGHSHICRGLKFMGIDSPGSFQSSWTVQATTVHKLPPNVDLSTAALVEPLAVACHDVRLGGVKQGELAVVIGGGPIGILVALVARQRGARVILSEIATYRLDFARSLGLEAFNPLETDLPALVRQRSADSGADVVFEVSGAKPAVLGMTDLLALRGRVVLVAIHAKPVEVNLFQFFWKELQLIGTRVYERQDYEEAIRLMAAGDLPLSRMISRVYSLEGLPRAFLSLEQNPAVMKILIDCRAT